MYWLRTKKYIFTYNSKQRLLRMKKLTKWITNFQPTYTYWDMKYMKRRLHITQDEHKFTKALYRVWQLRPPMLKIALTTRHRVTGDSPALLVLWMFDLVSAYKYLNLVARLPFLPCHLFPFYYYLRWNVNWCQVTFSFSVYSWHFLKFGILVFCWNLFTFNFSMVISPY